MTAATPRTTGELRAAIVDAVEPRENEEEDAFVARASDAVMAIVEPVFRELARRDERDAEQFQVQLREAERVGRILANRDATIARVREAREQIVTLMDKAAGSEDWSARAALDAALDALDAALDGTGGQS